MKLPSEGYFSKFTHVELARYFPEENRLKRIQDDRHQPVTIPWSEIYEFSSQHDDLGIYHSIRHYDIGQGGIDGPSLAPLHFDIDNKEDPQLAYDDTQRLTRYLIEEIAIPQEAVRVYFSGMKGYHVECHPPGEKVLTVNHGYVEIQELDENVHEIVSYEKNKDRIRRPQKNGGGRKNEKAVEFYRSSRKYSGNLLTFNVKGNVFRCTPNHHLTVQWTEEAAGKHCVYLMQRNNRWRIGQTKIQTSQGKQRLKLRMLEEDADAIWVLGVYDSAAECQMYETIWSTQFGIPQTCFVPSRYSRNQLDDEQANFVFDFLNTDTKVDKLLKHFGLSRDYPFRFNNGNGFHGGNPDPMTTRFKINAQNFIPGLMKLPVDEGIKEPLWTSEVTISSEHYEGEVYNIEMNEFHHYIVNNVIVHNCEPIAIRLNLVTENSAAVFRFTAEEFADRLGITSFDYAVYDPRRIWRLAGSRHQKTGLYKIPCKEMLLDGATIETIAKAAEVKPTAEDLAVPDQEFSPVAARFFAELVATYEDTIRERETNKLSNFLSQGAAGNKVHGDYVREFDPHTLRKECPAVDDMIHKAHTLHHLEHYERLFLCSLMTYTPEAIEYLQKIFSECSDYNFHISDLHIQDWIRRRENGIGGRPYTCGKAKSVGIICQGCEDLEPKLYKNDLGAEHIADPSPVRFAYKYHEIGA